MTRISLKIAGVLLAGVLAAGCSKIVSQEMTTAAKHPVEVTDSHVACTECHGAGDLIKGIQKPYSMFNHSSLFFREHSFYAVAGNNGEVCYKCHAISFCTDCHSTKNSVNPIIKGGSNVELEFTHRGDYIARHRFDGRADPASCFKCHGRSNNELCQRCHGNQ